MFSLFIGIICIIGLVIGTILSVSDFGIFFDAPAFGIVIVGAFLYCIAAGGDAVDRIENFGIGAVRFGWLGFFIGIIIMSASNIIISLDNIGPALAVALLTPFYGYFIKILTNVIVYRMDYNKLIEELNEEKLEN
tara:strand:- start:44 stop:448 length:405 start_codon:yes stop_codon:yes gene_type:complete